jgi:hypothetical protein
MATERAHTSVMLNGEPAKLIFTLPVTLGKISLILPSAGFFVYKLSGSLLGITTGVVRPRVVPQASGHINSRHLETAKCV